MKEKTGLNENTPVGKLYLFLRKQARQAAGVSVYRPARPDALFFSYLQGRNGASGQETEQLPEDPLFRVREGRKGNTPVLLWDADPAALSELLDRQDAAAVPAPDGHPVQNPAGETDTDLILRTCARSMREGTVPGETPELVRLVIFRLAFGEKELLAGELPGRIAFYQRQHCPLSALASRLIDAELAAAETAV
ncbi:MAG: hypothetical protein CW338_07250 [Clostridiales bacterium]|nr:hypothetical protein [Clostridiales bacterium]